MKIAHYSDIHAGYRATSHRTNQGVNVREWDGYITFSHIVTQTIAENVDAVVVAGDVFHSAFPSVRTIVFVQEQFRRLADAGIKVYILTGNHDTNDIRSDIAASKILDDPYRGINAYIEPYVKTEIADGVMLHLVSHHLYSEQNETMKKVSSTPGAINIFATHGSVIDPILHMKLHTEQSPREIVIPDFLLNDNSWDYVMLGHIHERGWVGAMNETEDVTGRKIFYNGSIIRRGFADKPSKLGRGWTLWTIESDGSFSYEFKNVPQRPQYDFEPIDASLYSANDLTDMLVANLKSTQTKENFDLKSAPIVRQTLANITPAKQAALDWKLIDSYQKLTLESKIEKKYVNQVMSNDESRDVKKLIGTNSNVKFNDMLSIYDEWVEDKEIFENISQDLREVVSFKAREFVRLGQEEVLKDE